MPTPDSEPLENDHDGRWTGDVDKNIRAKQSGVDATVLRWWPVVYVYGSDSRPRGKTQHDKP